MDFIVQLLGLAFDELELEPAEVPEAVIESGLGIWTVTLGKAHVFFMARDRHRVFVYHVIREDHN